MPLVLLRSPTIPGKVSCLITVETNNFFSLSSVISAPGLGLSTVSLQAVSLQISWLVTTVAIPQVVEGVFTFPSKCYWHVWSRVGSRIKDLSMLYWVDDHVKLHSNLSCLAQVAIFSRFVHVLQSRHVWVWVVRVQVPVSLYS